MSVLHRVTPEMLAHVEAIEWPPLTAAQAGILAPLFAGSVWEPLPAPTADAIIAEYEAASGR